MFQKPVLQKFSCRFRIIVSLPPATQQLMALLFGTWFRIVNHSEFNTMSSEAVAKSVAGSLFHTCSDDPKKVQKAVEVLQILIDDFGVSNMFGRRNIQYFAEMTRTGIRVNERYRFEYKYPTEGSVPCKFIAFCLAYLVFFFYRRPKLMLRGYFYFASGCELEPRSCLSVL